VPPSLLVVGARGQKATSHLPPVFGHPRVRTGLLLLPHHFPDDGMASLHRNPRAPTTLLCLSFVRDLA
jgi:hypothetical protein